MARRPDETKGGLVFQEGKRIEGGYYVIAVYDDPATKTVSFAAYELETDNTYTYPLSYTELDGLFKYNSELMNPTNRDGRYHWVIERLDFVQDARNKRNLCLAPEPTPEDLEVKEDGAALPEKKPFVAGKMDAVLRAKLIQELDTKDDHQLYIKLVQSDHARKRFLADLHSKRMLEQLKATQRMMMMDENREERMAKLEHIKATTQQKAQKYRSESEMQSQTKAQLDALMKQKEDEAIRRLIRDREEKKHNAEQSGEQSKQKRKARERSWKEQRDVEQEKMRLLEKKRTEACKKHELLIDKRQKEIAREAREANDNERREEQEKMEKKEEVLQKIEDEKAELRRQDRADQEHWEEMETVREENNLERELKRNQEEKNRVFEVKEKAKQEEEAKRLRREKANAEILLEGKLAVQARATTKKQKERQEAMRTERIAGREEERLRDKREEEYLRRAKEQQLKEDQKKAAQATGKRRSTLDTSKDLNSSQNLENLGEEEAGFQKLFEQQERERRHAEREEKRKREEDKQKSISQLGSNAAKRNQGEVLRFEQAKQQEYELLARQEEARLARDRAREEAARLEAEAAEMRVDLFERLEAPRDARNVAAEEHRLEATLERVRSKPLGSALPMVLAI